jgi:uncharacterized protein YprB with RNaseH-like and TPR domain
MENKIVWFDVETTGLDLSVELIKLIKIKKQGE